jgi:hypothetical protein
LKCVNYNEWLIAFTEKKNVILIEAIL